MKTIVPVVTAVVLALALMSASAAPTHHKRQTKTATAAQPQIACTVVGCIPVQRGCHPEMGYTPDGTPTGFDVVVCPNYTAGSTGRRNTSVKSLCWGFKSQGLAWSLVELACHFVQMGL